MYAEFYQQVKKVFGCFTLPLIIDDSLEANDWKLDLNYLKTSDAGLKSTITSGLGKVIKEFDILNLATLTPEVRLVMENIMKCFESTLENKYKLMTEKEWLDVIRVFYLLRTYLFENQGIIRSLAGTNLVDWFMYFEEH
ncbi:hypothetical protein [Clostridium sp.]|uniref:hypothetical protein n=1 Tax=Clostridium sp. TaxID=1506 RepID=UPI002FCAA58E